MRRVAAIVLPRLLCELAAAGPPLKPSRARPLGVVLLEDHQAGHPLDQLRAQTRLDAVDTHARQLGLREGISLAEAHAFVASLDVRVVSRSQVQRALARIAETCLAHGPSVGLAPPDAVHLDVTGAAHLAGGEEALAGVLRSRVAQLGHFSRVAIANGPRVAEAVARHGPDPEIAVEPGQEPRWLHELPVCALPIDQETCCWLMRLGVVTVADLTRLPPDQVSARIGDGATDVLRLASGQDPTPLCPYDPPAVLWEEEAWDEGIEQRSALLFVLKRLAARLSARLQGRGLALRAMELSIRLDRSIASLRGVDPSLRTRMDLPAPIDRTEDLLRTLRARLETLQLHAPALGLRLDAPLVVVAPRVQLDLSRDVSVSPDALPVLLAELAAEVGAARVGTLSLVDSHRPEARSRLTPVVLATRPSIPDPAHTGFGADTSRLLPSTVCLGRDPLSPGAVLHVAAATPLEIVSVGFDARLDGVEWWTPAPLSRDYLKVELRHGSAQTCAWVYEDRTSGLWHLHGWLD